MKVVANICGMVAAGALGLGAAQAELALPKVAQDSIIITTLTPRADAGPIIQGQELGAATPAPQARAGIETAALRPIANPPALVEGGGDRSVLPQRAGLPQPSIIVGERGEAQVFAPPRGPLGVAYAERARLRASQPQEYARLLAAGDFDPEPASLARAIQDELLRMACYGAAVDGVWGRGSITGVERYFTAAKTNAPGTSPEIGLYRAILAGPDLTCPAPPQPVAVRPAATQTAPARARQTQTQPRRTPAPVVPARPSPAQPAPPPAAAAPSGPRIAPGFGGTGLFR